MIETSPPRLCANSAESPIFSNVTMGNATFSTQDRELVSILDLQNIDLFSHNNSTEMSQLKDCF